MRMKIPRFFLPFGRKRYFFIPDIAIGVQRCSGGGGKRSARNSLTRREKSVRFACARFFFSTVRKCTQRPICAGAKYRYYNIPIFIPSVLHCIILYYFTITSSSIYFLINFFFSSFYCGFVARVTRQRIYRYTI